MRQLHDDRFIDSLAWVLMPDHLHWLIQLGEGKRLADVVRLFKGDSARDLNRYLHRQGSIWQRGYYDHALRREEDIKQVARYLVANPLRANLVQHIEEYPTGMQSGCRTTDCLASLWRLKPPWVFLSGLTPRTQMMQLYEQFSYIEIMPAM